MTSAQTHADFVAALRGARQADGGFSLASVGPSEVEPTAVAALALDDRQARAWLAVHQRDDGGFSDLAGRVDDASRAALVALVLRDPVAARKALAHAVAHRSLPLPNAEDPEKRTGWGWTEDARSLVEPTSRVLTALKALTPGDKATRAEAVRLLVDRRCDDGGWNFGNASVFDVDLRGYAQTTAIALIALQGESDTLTRPGLTFLERSWRAEPGGLTAAQALVAFRLHGVTGQIQTLTDALSALAGRRAFLGRTLTLAWVTLATGPDALLDPLRPRR